MKIYFEVTRPLFVKIMAVTPWGERDTLYPNYYQQSELLKPGVRYEIPPSDAQFQLLAEKPAGLEKLMVIGSEKHISPQLGIVTQKGEFTSEVLRNYPQRLSLDVMIQE